MRIINCAHCGQRIESIRILQKYCSNRCNHEAVKARRRALAAIENASLVREGEKLCRKCDTFKPLIEFKRRSLSGWLVKPGARCRECHNEYMTLLRQRKPRTVKQRLAQIRKNMNPAWIICRPCTACGLAKPVSEFRTGLTVYTCKACVNKQAAEHRKANPPRAKDRYGLTPTERRDLILKQDGKCTVCQREFVSPRETHIDHCHETGKIRGVLCRGCNHGIGHFQDNPDLLIAASIYLRMTR